MFRLYTLLPSFLSLLFLLFLSCHLHPPHSQSPVSHSGSLIPVNQTGPSQSWRLCSLGGQWLSAAPCLFGVRTFVHVAPLQAGRWVKEHPRYLLILNLPLKTPRTPSEAGTLKKNETMKELVKVNECNFECLCVKKLCWFCLTTELFTHDFLLDVDINVKYLMDLVSGLLKAKGFWGELWGDLKILPTLMEFTLLLKG